MNFLENYQMVKKYNLKELIKIILMSFESVFDNE